jgi:hypothetical protein
MNLVPGITGPRVTGENHADNTFFNRDLLTDFKLRLVCAARNVSVWWWLLHPFPL